MHAHMHRLYNTCRGNTLQMHVMRSTLICKLEYLLSAKLPVMCLKGSAQHTEFVNGSSSIYRKITPDLLEMTTEILFFSFYLCFAL